MILCQDSCQLWKRKQEHDGIYWWNSKWEILKPSFLISPPKSWRLNPVVCVIFTAANEKRRLTQDMRAAADKDFLEPGFFGTFPRSSNLHDHSCERNPPALGGFKKFLFVFFVGNSWWQDLFVKFQPERSLSLRLRTKLQLERSCRQSFNWNVPDKVLTRQL